MENKQQKTIVSVEPSMICGLSRPNVITLDSEAKSLRMTALTASAKVTETESSGHAGQTKLTLEFEDGERLLIVIGTDPKDKSKRKDWLTIHSLLSKVEEKENQMSIKLNSKLFKYKCTQCEQTFLSYPVSEATIEQPDKSCPFCGSSRKHIAIIAGEQR